MNTATVPRDEVAIEEPEDGRLGDPLGETEIILSEGLRLGQPRLVESPLKGSLLAGSLLQADQRGQDLQLVFCKVSQAPIEQSHDRMAAPSLSPAGLPRPALCGSFPEA